MQCTGKSLFFSFDIQNNLRTQHVLILYFSCNSMNNLLSHNGLIDARMRASEKYLSVLDQIETFFKKFKKLSVSKIVLKFHCLNKLF